MDIYVSQEVLAGFGIALGALIVALLVFVRWLLTHLSSFAKALGQHAEVNAALSGQLKDIIQERREDRQQWEAERDGWANERQLLTKQLSTQASETERRFDSLSREYTRLNAQLTAEKAARERGERENALKIQQLQGRITDLERERDELKKERDDLKIERDKLSTRVDDLASEIDRLKKHGTGPISDAAREVAREAMDEAAPKSNDAGQGAETPDNTPKEG